MIVPNKFVRFADTPLSKLDVLLRELANPVRLPELFNRTMARFRDVDEFILTIDVLHVLGQVEVDMQTGMVRRAD